MLRKAQSLHLDEAIAAEGAMVGKSSHQTESKTHERLIASKVELVKDALLQACNHFGSPLFQEAGLVKKKCEIAPDIAQQFQALG